MKKTSVIAIVLSLVVVGILVYSYMSITGNVSLTEDTVSRTISGTADNLQVTLSVNSQSYAIGVSETIPYLCNAYAVSEQGVIKPNTIEWLFAPARYAGTLSYKLSCPLSPTLSGEWYTTESEGDITGDSQFSTTTSTSAPTPTPTPTPTTACTEGAVKYFNCPGRANVPVDEKCVNGVWVKIKYDFKLGYNACSCDTNTHCLSGYSCVNKVCTAQTTTSTPTQTTTPTTTIKTMKLQRCVLTNGDQFASVTSDCEKQKIVGPLGYLITTNPSGTVGIYRCSLNGQLFESANPNCEGGSTKVATLGYAYSTNVAGTAPLYRCKLGGEYLSSRSSSCEGAVGAINEGVIAYVRTMPSS